MSVSFHGDLNLDQFCLFVSVCRSRHLEDSYMDFMFVLPFIFQMGNAALYNSYLQSLKRSITNRRLEVFWDLLVQGMLSLYYSGLQDFSQIIPPLCCLNHKSVSADLILAVCLTDAVTLISKDEVEESTVSKNEANQVI